MQAQKYVKKFYPFFSKMEISKGNVAYSFLKLLAPNQKFAFANIE